jgi:hypothetical protein
MDMFDKHGDSGVGSIPVFRSQVVVLTDFLLRFHFHVNGGRFAISSRLFGHQWTTY